MLMTSKYRPSATLCHGPPALMPVPLARLQGCHCCVCASVGLEWWKILAMVLQEPLLHHEAADPADRMPGPTLP
jgi:hypothetical protein